MSEIVIKIASDTQNAERDLIRLCACLDDANKELHAYFSRFSFEPSGAGASDDRLEDNQERWEQMAFRAANLRARTLEGVRARVRALGCDFVADILRSADLPDEAERVMIEALIRDLTADD